MADVRIEPLPVHFASLRLSRKVPADAVAPLLAAAGVAVPGAPCSFGGDATKLCAWVEPRAWLLMGDAPLALASTPQALVTDVSARSAVFELVGPGARDLVAAGCDPALVVPGRVARTRFASLCTALIVQLAPDRYRIVVDVSIAATVADWLNVSAGTTAA